MTLTATRIERYMSTRKLYGLSQPTTTIAHPEPFHYLVLSLGRDGDTCVFPSDDEGRIHSFVGFGYGMGPSRWLLGSEFDGYVAACIRQHEADGGAGLTVAPDEFWTADEIGGSDGAA